MAVPTEVWPVVGTTVAALLAWLGVWTKTKGDKDVADKPDWNSFTDQIQEWTEQRLAERDKKIDRLETDVRDLRGEVSSLRRKYNAALRMVRELTRRHPDTSVDIPHEIADDL